jgi:hypothetical protein
MRKTLLLLVLLFFASIGYSQFRFSTQPDSFVVELTQLISANKREQSKLIAEQFQLNYIEGNLIADQVVSIRNICQMMLGKKIKPYPYMEKYIEAINKSIDFRLTYLRFNDWNDIVRSMLSAEVMSKKSIKSFLEFSVLFYGEKTLFKSFPKTWVVNNEDYVMDYNDGNPRVSFSALTLTGYTKGDTVHVLNTDGVYYPLSENWQGTKGKITWEGTNLRDKNVYVEFGPYHINLREGQFRIDTVTLYYKEVFKRPIKGSFMHKLLINESTKDARYPEFTSFEKRIELDDLIEGVLYRGGFKLAGANIMGSGNSMLKAELHFFNKKGQTVAISKASSYMIKKNSASSARAQITVYFAGDSIIHPGAQIKYLIREKALIISKGESGIGRAPFFDSYHDLEMNFERMIYKIDDDKIDISMGVSTAQTPAYFHSTNFFDMETYDQYQGVTSYNPLASLRVAKNRMDTNVVRADLIPKFFHKDLSLPQIEGMLYRLVGDGFIDYDAEKGEVTIKDKVDRYVLASIKRIDFDVIRLKSKTDTLNAYLNLKTRELVINGVYAVTLNSKHFVHMFPSDKQVKMYENRDMAFKGTLFGGRLDFYGDNYYFNYDRYDVLLKNLDSLVINIPTEELDEYGEPIMEPVKTVFENINGTLYIDQPFNKSGREDFDEYPIFVNNQSSFAFYDKGAKFDSIYKKDSFYFAIDTFTIDSLNTFNFFTQKFTGKLVSAGIFPDLYEELKLREDKSMGFRTTTPVEGYPLYGGIATYNDIIDLSNKGLQGDGIIHFLNADIDAPEILFMPDSLEANSDHFKMQRAVINGVDFPTVNGDTNQIIWKPYRDSMVIKMTDDPFTLFDDFATFRGELNLRSTGLIGHGKADWEDAILYAENMNIGGNSFQSDTASLQIKAKEEEQVALDLPNVTVDLDFDNGKGKMRTNFDTIQTVLPFNLYATDMNRFEWDMSERTIDLFPPDGESVSTFYSNHKGQDSLKFNASSATYYLDSFEVTAHGVPYIAVADVHVIPFDSNVTVREGADMKPLEHATINVDSLNKNHIIKDVFVHITGKNRMYGNGKYEYVNRSGEKQIFDFHDIAVNALVDTVYTYAKGTIYDTMHFLLDPKIQFRGNVMLHSKKKWLNFKGVSKLLLNDSTTVKTSWFKIDDPIDPKHVEVSASNKVNINDDSLYTGIMKQMDSTNLYTTLIGRKNYYMDKTIFNASGKLKFDEKTGEYLVGDSTRLNNSSALGNILKYNDKTGDVNADGKTDFDLDYGLAKITGMGHIEKKKLDSLYRMKFMIALELYIPDEVLSVVFDDLLDISFSGDAVDMFSQQFRGNLLNYLGDEEAFDNLFIELNKNGELAFPKDFTPPTFLFNDVNLIWDEYSNSFIGYGPVGLVSFNGKFVGNTFEKSFFEMGYRGSQDYFNIYLENDDEWYFLNYQNKKISVLTSNVYVNGIMTNLKIKDRTKRTKEGVIQFGISTAFRKNKFYQKMLYWEEKLENNN